MAPIYGYETTRPNGVDNLLRSNVERGRLNDIYIGKAGPLAHVLQKCFAVALAGLVYVLLLITKNINCKTIFGRRCS